MDSEQREQIGFSFIIDELQIMTPFGMEERKNIRPFKKEEQDKLAQELDNIELMLKGFKKNPKAIGEIERVFCRVKDIRNTVKRCREGLTLDDVELYEMKYFALLMEELKTSYEVLELQIGNIKLHDLKEIVDILDPEGKRISTFYIYEAYSDVLRQIRTEKRRLEGLIKREPDEKKLLLLKAKRLEVVVLEEEEELKIRKQLTERLSSFVNEMEENIAGIGKLDFLLAKCKLALSFGAVKPIIAQNMKIYFKDMINPEIAKILEHKGKNFTPLSLELEAGTTVITGANMGGKSVALKTLVLNLMLGQCGFYVFAKEAKFPALNFIYFISDDLQSVSKGLSTFGAEIVKLREVIEALKSEDGFIALDEFARGTNPREGFYLVKSLCRYLNMKSSISLISTHYDGVVEKDMVHYQVIGLRNIDFKALKSKIDLNKLKSIDVLQEHMEYRLEKVAAEDEVPKDALNISMLLGLQEEVIDLVKEYYKDGENN